MTSLYPLIPALTVDISRFIKVYGHKSLEDMCNHFLKHFPQYRGFVSTHFEEQVRRAYNVIQLREGKKIIEEKEPEVFDAEKAIKEYEDKMDEVEKEKEFKELKENISLVKMGLLNNEDIPPIRRFKEVSKKMFNRTYHITKAHSSLKAVIGLDSTIEKLKNSVEETLFKRGPKAFILSGPPGCGKSLIAEGFAFENQAVFFSVTNRFILELSKKMKLLDQLFAFAREYAPIIVCFGDNLFSANKSDSESLAICAKLKNLLKGIMETDEKIYVIVETDKTEDIPSDLIHMIPEIYVPCLEINGRYEFLQMVLQKNSYDVNFDLKEVALRTCAFTGQDMINLVSQTRKKALFKQFAIFEKTLGNDYIGDPVQHWRNHVKYDKVNIILEKDDFLQALQEYIPILKKIGFPTVPEVSFDEIGGMKRVKAELQRLIMNPIMYPDLYAKISSLSNRPPGLLFWGPPGCGKTMIAKGMANKAGINFLSVAGAEALNMYQGESEKNIRRIFNRASKVAPCIIFFDEFDAICQRRSNSSEGSRTSITTSLLTEIDGIHQRKGVYVMAATNRPDTIDQAALRPGRFDKILYVGLPTESERVSTFKACLEVFKEQLTDDINLEELAKMTPNFSPADINCLCGEAEEEAYIEVEPKEGEKLETDPKISLRHFIQALKVRRPSVSASELKKYENLRIKYESR